MVHYRVLARFAEDGSSWSYTMLSHRRVAEVWEQIRELPGRDRPVKVRDAFMAVLTNLDWETGYVDLTRAQLSVLLTRAGHPVAPRHVTEVMGVLVRLGVVVKERRRFDGDRGLGRVCYRVVGDIAWRGSEDARQAAIAEAGEVGAVTVVPFRRSKRERGE